MRDNPPAKIAKLARHAVAIYNNSTISLILILLCKNMYIYKYVFMSAYSTMPLRSTRYSLNVGFIIISS